MTASLRSQNLPQASHVAGPEGQLHCRLISANTVPNQGPNPRFFNALLRVPEHSPPVFNLLCGLHQLSLVASIVCQELKDGRENEAVDNSKAPADKAPAPAPTSEWGCMYVCMQRSLATFGPARNQLPAATAATCHNAHRSPGTTRHNLSGDSSLSHRRTLLGCRHGKWSHHSCTTRSTRSIELAKLNTRLQEWLWSLPSHADHLHNPQHRLRECDGGVAAIAQANHLQQRLIARQTSDY